MARYVYDGNGNRERWDNGTLLPADTATATLDRQDRLARWRDTAYLHDDAGELLRRIAPGGDTTRYEYDALGNLNRVTLANGDTVSYAVDGVNRRIGRRVDGSWSGGWVYRNALEVAAEVSAAGAVVRRYVPGDGWQTPAVVIEGDTAYRVISDHLGSVRAVVNAVTGMVRERRDYTAWGEVELEQGTPQALGYAGGLTDPSTRLIRFGARDHDPSAGRWTAKDPIGFNARRTNLYAYASNDPVNLVDPSGLAEGTQDECLEWLQGALDVIGTADPTGMADLANAALYAGQGKLADAGVSTLGMVPFLGDAAKLGRVAARGGEWTKEVSSVELWARMELLLGTSSRSCTEGQTR